MGYDPSKNVKYIGAYEGVILGGTVHERKWLPAADDFFEANVPSLTKISIASFLTCLTHYHPTPQNQKRVVSFLNLLYESNSRIKPVGLGAFAEKIDYSKLSPVVRLFMRRKMIKLGFPEGDFRD